MLDLSKIDWLLKYRDINNETAEYLYEPYSIYKKITSIDIITFNLNFIKYINQFLKSNEISKTINELESADKHERVIKFGYFLRNLLSKNISLRDYMVAFRNLVFLNFYELRKMSERSTSLHRLNFDDIEFSTLSTDPQKEEYVNEQFIDITKIKKFDHVIVLNKNSGIFYVIGGNIVDIKYTGGWVNIPIYRLLLTKIIKFLIDDKKSISILNDELIEIIENIDNSKIFGYEDCPLSMAFKPNETIPMSTKLLFIANTMSKFSMLLNKI